MKGNMNTFTKTNYIVLLITQIKILNLGQLVPLMLKINTHVAITWMGFHLRHTPLKKIKPFVGKSLSLVS